VRVYVETTVWSFAFAEDVPDYAADTRKFFDRCRSRAVVPIASALVLTELRRADPPTRDQLLALVREIGPEIVQGSDAASRLAAAFLRHGAVPPSKPDDAMHVAIAFGADVDVLVSWNFKHIASVRRAERFNAIALLEGFGKPLRIVSPLELLDD
jgi:hypothetical protein